MYDPILAAKMQKIFTAKRGLPIFAPPDGICCACGGRIYGERGYSVEYAASALITSCPYCATSYVD